MSQENKLRILLVDDDSTDRELFTDAIHLAGKRYCVDEASNGQEALDYLNKFSSQLPDLIILDLNMPVMDGRETLLAIRAHELYKSIPVCIMSTSTAHFDILSAYSSGANLFLAKPFDFKELIEMLTSLLTLFSKYVTLPGKTVNEQ